MSNGTNGRGVAAAQRFSAANPCPICGGHDDARRGRGERCWGFLSDDGKWAHCTREDHAGRAAVRGGSGTYAHALRGRCPCGIEHGPAELELERRPRRKGSGSGQGKIVATYPYRDESGELLFEVLRYEPKGFRQRRPKPGGGWDWSLGDVRRTLYRLPELLADGARAVLIVEGEKSADRLAAAGFVATCSPGGCRKWRDEFAEALRGRRVFVLPDNDEPGRAHADQVARSLHGVAAEVRVVDLPDLPEKGDVFDWFESGGSPESLRAIMKAAPVWSPPADGGEDEDDRPEVRLTADIHLAVDAIAETFPDREDIFVRGGQLVWVRPTTPERKRRKDAAADDETVAEIRRTFSAEGTPVALTLNGATGRAEVSRSFRFAKFCARSKDWVRVPPPTDVVEAVLGRGHYPSGRELVGIIESPTLRPDGSLLSTPGYDPATGLLYAPSAAFPAIPERPTLDDARAAAGALGRVVRDFPFAADADRGSWFAYCLTVLCRPAIDGPVPLTMFSANVAGTGKTYLASIPCLIATGRPPAMDGYSADNSEMEKRLVSVALAGDQAIIWDNAESGTAIGGAALDRSLSSSGAFRGRVLGQSKLSDDGRGGLPWRTVQAVTGNALTTKADARRRVVPCYLDCDDLQPERRPPEAFALYREAGMSLSEYVKANRPELVAACLTIVRAFIAAGKPVACKGPPMGDPFGAWDRTIRQCVAWATGLDALGGRDRLDSGDETTLHAATMVAAWKGMCSALDGDRSRPAGYHLERGVSTADAESALDSWHRGATPGAPPSHADVLALFADVPRKGRATPDSRSLGFALRSVCGMPTRAGRIAIVSTRRGVRFWTVAGVARQGGGGGDGCDGGDDPTLPARDVIVTQDPDTPTPAMTNGVNSARSSPPSQPSPPHGPPLPADDCDCFKLDCPRCNGDLADDDDEY